MKSATVTLKTVLARSRRVHIAFNANESQLFGRSVTIVEKKLLARLNGPLGKNANPVVAVNHHNFGGAIRIHRMIGETNFVAFARGVHHEIVVEVEEEAAHVLVVNFAAPIGLVLRDDFAAIFRDELVFLGRFFQVDAPTGDVGRRQQKMLKSKRDTV